MLLGAALFAASVLGADAAKACRGAEAVARWKAAHHAPKGFYVDAARKAVVFIAEAKGLRHHAELDHLLVGPETDCAHKALGVTVAAPSEIAGAIKTACGLDGLPASVSESRPWPQGDPVEITVNGRPWRAFVSEGTNAVARTDAATDAVAQTNATGTVAQTNVVPVRMLDDPVLFTGGTLGADLMPPCAVFSFSLCAQSQFQFDSRRTSRDVAGRFRAATDVPPGTLLEVVVSRARAPHFETVTYDVSSTVDLAMFEMKIRRQTAGRRVYAQVAFAEDMTISDARFAAEMFRELDGTALRLNGAPEGQFHYTAFLPDNGLRVRLNRAIQPFELRFGNALAKDVTFTFIAENWANLAHGTFLKPVEYAVKSPDELPKLIRDLPLSAQKADTILIFASMHAPLSELTKYRAVLYPRIQTFYIFGE